jgi:hypothetical protein
VNKTWELKWDLRWESRAYQASTEYFGGGTVTKYRSVLQQAFQCVETGEVEWRDVPTVRASQGERNG